MCSDLVPRGAFRFEIRNIKIKIYKMDIPWYALFAILILCITLLLITIFKTPRLNCSSTQPTNGIISNLQTLLENTNHKKGLSAELVEQRRETIDQNLALITKSNLEQKALVDNNKTDKVVSFSANKFLPYTHQEIIQLFTGLLIPSDILPTISPSRQETLIADDDLVQTNKQFSIDFTKIPSTQARYDIFYGISPRLFDNPQDQGTCGSCWAFSSCAVAGAQISKSTVTENVVTLSVQYYIDCVQQSFGCDGGFPIFVYEKIFNDGFVVLDDPANPYIQEKKQTCTNGNKFPVSLAGIISFGKEDVGFFTSDNLMGAERFRSLELNIPSDDMIEKIKKILFFYGPMTVLIYVDPLLPYISSGIYTATDTKNGEKMKPNHAVVIAGFGVDLDGDEYWIIRNSWGKDWAQGGYFELSTKSPICGLTVPIFGSIKDLPLLTIQ